MNAYHCIARIYAGISGVITFNAMWERYELNQYKIDRQLVEAFL